MVRSSVALLFAVACAPQQQAVTPDDSETPVAERGVRAFACPSPTSELPEDSPMRYKGITEEPPADTTGLDQLNVWLDAPDRTIRTAVDVQITDAVIAYAAGDLIWLQGPDGAVRAYDVPELGYNEGTKVSFRVTEVVSYYGNLEITDVADVEITGQVSDVWAQDASRASLDDSMLAHIAKAYGQVIDTWTGAPCLGTCALISNEVHSWYVDSAVRLDDGDCVKLAAPVSWATIEEEGYTHHAGPVFDAQQEGAIDVYAEEDVPTCEDALVGGFGAFSVPEGFTTDMYLDRNDDWGVLTMAADARCTVRVTTLNGADITVTASEVDIESDTEDRGVRELVLHNPLGDETGAFLMIERGLAPVCTPYTIDVTCE